MYFEKLCWSIGPSCVAQYTEEENEMQRDRLEDVTVMDGFDVKDKDGMPPVPL